MIIWLNGGFGAGKTSLAEELRHRVRDAVVFDPEELGSLLWRWVEPNDDFQDLASWRELVIATAVSLSRHHAETLIVPMSLINAQYRMEILGGLADAGVDILHVFLEADGHVLRARLEARATFEGRDAAHSARDWAFSRLDAAVAAATEQPDGTLILRSDRLSPSELADEVLAAGAGSFSARATTGPRREGSKPG